MLRNFQLTAITKRGNDFALLEIPLHRSLQESLCEMWDAQHQSFTSGKEEIDFDAGYNPEVHENFKLPDFELPEWLAGENSTTISSLDSLSQEPEVLRAISGLAAFATEENGQEIILFQNFSRSHVIQPGRYLLLRNDTYESSNNSTLTLDDKLTAVFYPDERKLIFHNFRTANTFLPLADFYEDASEAEIRDVLSHNMFFVEDADALATGANQWFRKRFAMLRDSELLDNYSADDIAEHSEGYEVDIQLREGKIVFPAEKAPAKKLLQFLNEEIFKGAITETLFETNSKREAD